MHTHTFHLSTGVPSYGTRSLNLLEQLRAWMCSSSLSCHSLVPRLLCVGGEEPGNEACLVTDQQYSLVVATVCLLILYIVLLYLLLYSYTCIHVITLYFLVYYSV